MQKQQSREEHKRSMDKKKEQSRQKKTNHTPDAILQEKKREMQLDKAFELGNAAAGADCTGSVPAAPLNTEEWNNYNTAHQFQPQPVKEENR